MSLDLQKIINDQNLDVNELAAKLFPGNKHSYLALHRVIKGKTELSASQISTLSQVTGLTIDELFGGSWRTVAKGDLITFSKGDVLAELNTKTWITRIYKNNTLIFEDVIVSQSISLKEFLKLVDSKIN